jgi:N-acetylglucosaminyldiphosphoundecaprenol N-acetyl-beta-D-mannosaminyltransferase
MLDRKLICKSFSEFTDARVVTFLNPYSFLKIYQAGLDLNKFDRVCIDGIALKIFLEFVYPNTSLERISFDFTSIADYVFDDAASNNQSGFILGSDHTSNSAFIKKIENMFPGITLQGRSRYFNNKEEISSCIDNLTNSDFDFVVIGMGAVKQEEIAIDLMESGFSGRIYTCGGFIHQTAMQDGQYYPTWVDKLNLRFAYRMIKEPSTIQRYLFDYPRSFALLFRNIRSFKH